MYANANTMCTQEHIDDSIRLAFLDMLSFAWVDYHIISSVSGFSRISAFLSGRVHNIYIVKWGKYAESVCTSDAISPMQVAKVDAGI